MLKIYHTFPITAMPSNHPVYPVYSFKPLLEHKRFPLSVVHRQRSLCYLPDAELINIAVMCRRTHWHPCLPSGKMQPPGLVLRSEGTLLRRVVTSAATWRRCASHLSPGIQCGRGAPRRDRFTCGQNHSVHSIKISGFANRTASEQFSCPK